MNNFNLVSLLDETVDYVKGKAPFSKESITIQKKYSEKEILMTGDASKLNQAFVNIITNGYQAMNGEGLLTVYINPNGNNADIVITDTGEGIESDSISKIFDPFVTTKEMGVGLGLAISKRIIEDHKGELHVESSVSEGTSFTITLPVQNAI
jgi:two-component system NtrC family sensor kinase